MRFTFVSNMDAILQLALLPAADGELADVARRAEPDVAARPTLVEGDRAASQ